MNIYSDGGGVLRGKINIIPSRERIKFILTLSLALCSLSLGTSIYLLSRDTSNILYHFSGFLGVSTQVETLRGLTPALPAWVVYSLPDALWMFSFSIFILAIWGFQRSREAIAWICIALAIGTILELLQVFGIIPGQFDWCDLVSICIAAILSFCFTYKSPSL
jgi:hypothetical protein